MHAGDLILRDPQVGRKRDHEEDQQIDQTDHCAFVLPEIPPDLGAAGTSAVLIGDRFFLFVQTHAAASALFFFLFRPLALYCARSLGSAKA